MLYTFIIILVINYTLIQLLKNKKKTLKQKNINYTVVLNSDNQTEKENKNHEQH